MKISALVRTTWFVAIFVSLMTVSLSAQGIDVFPDQKAPTPTSPLGPILLGSSVQFSVVVEPEGIDGAMNPFGIEIRGISAFHDPTCADIDALVTSLTTFLDTVPNCGMALSGSCIDFLPEGVDNAPMAATLPIPTTYGFDVQVQNWLDANTNNVDFLDATSPLAGASFLDDVSNCAINTIFGRVGQGGCQPLDSTCARGNFSWTPTENAATGCWVFRVDIRNTSMTPSTPNGEEHACFVFVEVAECMMIVGTSPITLPISAFPGPVDTLRVEPLLMDQITLAFTPTLDVPPIPSLAGVPVYVQAFYYNPSFTPNDPLKMSPSLKYVIGDSVTPIGANSGITLTPRHTVVHPGGVIDPQLGIPGF